MKDWSLYWLGRWRLLFGFCPLCDSSPPDPDCRVCEGTYRYGHEADVATWRQRLDHLRGNLTIAPPAARRPTVGTTTDPTDPRLGHGSDDAPVPQQEVYLVLSEDEWSHGYRRPIRHSYVHDECGTLTRMNDALAKTYARDPKFYGSTYCVGCHMHRPVSEFHWDGTAELVGS